MTNPTETRDNVRWMLEELGQAGTLTQTSGGTYDPVTSSVSGGSDTVQKIVAATTHYDDRDVDGQNVLSQDRRIVISMFSPQGQLLQVTPAMGDSVSVGPIVGRIVATRAVLYQGITMSYICQVRM